MSTTPSPSEPSSRPAVVARAVLFPFILVTLLFPLWGFANDITNPMVAAFKNILLISNFESSLVQAAFYGGYALMAIPAALFIKRFSYKKGILVGLALYAVGCLLFIPSGMTLAFAPFLLAYLIMTSGLSFLETTANPYILSMGDASTATRRLNLSQAFNPMGSIVGMFVASMYILINLNPTTEAGRRALQGVAAGEAVHHQVAAAQENVAGVLAGVLAEPDWFQQKKLVKKAREQSEVLAQQLTVLADPNPERAGEIRDAIAAQPKPNKFTAAVEAVAVVLQIREKVQPTPAEAERDKLYFGPGGLELAGLLARERALFQDHEVFAKTQPLLTPSAETARDLAGAFARAYEAREATGVDTGKLAEQVQGVRSDLAAAGKEFATLPADPLKRYAGEAAAELTGIQKADLDIVVWPYVLMGGFLVLVLALFALKLPAGMGAEGGTELHFKATLKRLLRNERYLEGVVAQTFYVGAQIMCWTFIIQYAESELGLSKSTAQNCNILAMLIFVSSRFVCTFLLHYIRPGMLLGLLALGGMMLTAGTIFIQGYAGLYCLIGVSACMSLMFPTIYGIALDGLGDDAKLASAGLIMAIGGGCAMPPLQGAILDLPPIDIGFMELASVRASFFLPLICFVVIAVYGFRTWFIHHRKDVTA